MIGTIEQATKLLAVDGFEWQPGDRFAWSENMDRGFEWCVTWVASGPVYATYKGGMVQWEFFVVSNSSAALVERGSLKIHEGEVSIPLITEDILLRIAAKWYEGEMFLVPPLDGAGWSVVAHKEGFTPFVLWHAPSRKELFETILMEVISE